MVTAREIPASLLSRLQTELRLAGLTQKDMERAGINADLREEVNAIPLKGPNDTTVVEQATRTIRRKYIASALDVDVDSQAALQLSEMTLGKFRGRMRAYDLLLSQGKLAVGYRQPTEEDTARGINVEVWRWDLLKIPCKTVSANLEIANSESIVYADPTKPENRSDFLLASNQRVKDNVQLLGREYGFQLTDAGDLLAMNNEELRGALAEIGKTTTGASVETLRTEMNRRAKKE